MSTLFNEQHVWVAKVTLQKKDSSGSDSFYLSTEYYGSGKLYASSPVVYPVLAEFPAVRRGYEREAAIRYDVQLVIDAATSFQEVGKTFADLGDLYTFHGGAVELRFYLKPTHTTTTHSDSVNIQQTLEIVRADLSDDQAAMTLVCRDTWFKDKELSKKLLAADFTALADAWTGHYGAWVFGKAASGGFDVVIDAPFVNSLRLFSGWVIDWHPLNQASAIFVRADKNDYNEEEWPTCELAYDRINTAGTTGLTGGSGTALALKDYNYAISINPSGATTGALIAKGVYLSLKKTGSPTLAIGELKIGLYFQLNGQPVGGVLAETTIDPSTLTTSFADYELGFSRPVVMTNSELYMLVVEWSATDASNYVSVQQSGSASATIYRKNRTVSAAGWVSTSAAPPQMELLLLQRNQEADFWNDGSDNDSYAYFDFQETVESPSCDISGLQFKIGLRGAEDSSGNTYGAGASALLSNPARLVDFMLRSSAGLGLASGSVDTSAISTVATALDTAGYTIGAAIDRKMMVSDFILELCRHSRLTLFKTKTGKISLHNPGNISTSPTKISWARHQAELRVVGLVDTDPADVVNDFLVAYDLDALERPKDPAALLRGQPDKYAASFELNESSTDTLRAGIAEDSIALYGRRERRAELPYFTSSADAESVENYNFDRYAKVRQRLSVEVPVRDFYSAVDVFSDIIVEHLDLPVSGGSKPLLKLFSDTGSGTRYQLATAYYESTPMLSWTGGEFKGRVVEVVAIGAVMRITLEIVPTFSANS